MAFIRAHSGIVLKWGKLNGKRSVRVLIKIKAAALDRRLFITLPELYR